MWHNSYEVGMIDEIRKCGESKYLQNQKGCPSKLIDLGMALEAFNTKKYRLALYDLQMKWVKGDPGYCVRERNCSWDHELLNDKNWWRVDDVAKLNGSWSDARDACGF